jgi:putative selenium metabolism hydrolase
VLALSLADTQVLSQLAQTLIRTPSLPGDEGAVAALLAEAMRHSGFEQVWTDRTGNVIGRYGRGRGPVLLFDGHMDTVDVGERSAWTHDPFAGTVENGSLYGRGAVDMKSALAAMVQGIKLLAAADIQLGGTLYMACVVQEEPCEGMAVRAFLEESGIQPDYVVLGEPTNLGLYMGQRGRVELEVSAHGRAGHASLPQSGVNAISAAARLIFGIELLASQLLSDPVLGHGTIAVTQITSSAGSLNSIPDLCTLVIDRRLTLGETEARAIAEIQQITLREGIRADVATLEYALSTYTGHLAQGVSTSRPGCCPQKRCWRARRPGRWKKCCARGRGRASGLSQPMARTRWASPASQPSASAPATNTWRIPLTSMCG